LPTSVATYFIWKWYQAYRRRVRESATYEKGPAFKEAIKHTIPRTALVEEIRQVTTPAKESRLYPVIIGEHGTGKTSLIKLAVNGVDEPKDIVYADIPSRRRHWE
jgi:type IV secretory pathway ATPase VirB11/archaellum biosynthesis ATPase